MSVLLNRLRNHADYPDSTVKCLLHLVEYKIISLVYSHYQKESQHFQNRTKRWKTVQMYGIQEAFNNFTKHVSSIVTHSVVLLIVLSFISPYSGVTSLLFSVLCFFELQPKEICIISQSAPKWKWCTDSFPHLLIIKYFYFVKRGINFILKSPVYLLSQHESFLFGILDLTCLHTLNIFQPQTTLFSFVFHFNQTWILFFIVGLFTIGMQITSYIICKVSVNFFCKGSASKYFSFRRSDSLSKLLTSTFVAWKQPQTVYKWGLWLYTNKTFLWIIKLKFHIIFMCDKILFFCWIFSSIKKCKGHLCGSYRNKWWAGFALQATVWQPVYYILDLYIV